MNDNKVSFSKSQKTLGILNIVGENQKQRTEGFSPSK